MEEALNPILVDHIKEDKEAQMRNEQMFSQIFALINELRKMIEENSKNAAVAHAALTTDVAWLKKDSKTNTILNVTSVIAGALGAIAGLGAVAGIFYEIVKTAH